MFSGNGLVNTLPSFIILYFVPTLKFTIFIVWPDGISPDMNDLDP